MKGAAPGLGRSERCKPSRGGEEERMMVVVVGEAVVSRVDLVKVGVVFWRLKVGRNPKLTPRQTRQARQAKPDRPESAGAKCFGEDNGGGALPKRDLSVSVSVSGF
jgi:hypothetical protein